MAEVAMGSQVRLRENIYRQGVAPQLAADVLALATSCREANLRWRGPGYRAADDDELSGRSAVRAASIGLGQVPEPVAPFCHDVLLYRASMGPGQGQQARQLLGPSMWHLVLALGGWQRVHRLSLGRLSEEAYAARMQMPTFLQPPAYPLRPVDLACLRELLAPWSRQIAAYRRLRPAQMVPLQLTAGAWLWLLDRAGARLLAEDDEEGACRKLMASAYRLREAVGLRAA